MNEAEQGSNFDEQSRARELLRRTKLREGVLNEAIREFSTTTKGKSFSAISDRRPDKKKKKNNGESQRDVFFKVADTQLYKRL